MRTFYSKVRYRARMRTTKANNINNRIMAMCPCIPLVLLVLQILYCVLNGEVFGGGVEASSSSRSVLLSSFNLGAFTLIYSVLPHYTSTKSIRHGKEVQEPEDAFFNSSLALPLTGNHSQPLSNSSDPVTIVFSSRTLQVSDEENNTTSRTTIITPSEELERSLDSDSSADEVDDSSNLREIKRFHKRKRQRRREKGDNRLKRQMGLAAEVALMAPALQTMGCLPKFFCGLNSKAPNQETTAINDLAYLIKFAMLDDDDAEFEDPLFSDKPTNNRGKDGLTRLKEDLIFENMAEDELIQEDPANLPFVMQDMEERIQTKTKPGSKLRLDQDLMDSIIVEPEQSTFGSFLTGIKSVFRIGRNEAIFSGSSGNYSSHVTPRSERSRRSTSANARGKRRRNLQPHRWRKQQFWKTPQFRQDMELAQRIGKADQDDAKCSTTFNVCPYTVNEMMDIVHGGYKKRQRKRRKKKPQFYVNAQGPPEESSEEVRKPFKDPENLVTTTTPKTEWLASDPESQIYYAIFPHKAIEKGVTTVPTTRRPTAKLRVNKPTKRHHGPGNKIQSHVEYEHDDEGSLESRKPEHLDVLINNKFNHNQFKKKPSWWSGHQRPAPPLPPGRQPGRRPPPHLPHNSHPHGENGVKSHDDRSSSEEVGKKKRTKGGNDSESTEDDDNESSEEKSQQGDLKVVSTSPQPPLHEQVSIVQTYPVSQLISSVATSDIMKPLQPDFQLANPKHHPPIATPRPKYKIQRVKERKRKKNVKTLPAVYTAKSVQEEGQATQQDKSKEESEEEEDEESIENSSEEKSKPSSPVPPGPQQHQRLNINGIRGRPSEEIKGPMAQRHHNDNPRSGERGDPDNSDEDVQNSNSAPVNSNELSRELPKSPFHARPPPPHLMKSNGSNEYSGENDGRPQMRPINYSYFKKRPRDEPNGQHMAPPPHTPQGPPEPPPTTTTQKYSTGFLGFLFGGNKKKPAQKPPIPHAPNESQEDEADDLDDDDDDDTSDEQQEPKRTITGPSGQFEVGHLKRKPPPKSLKPNFTPPQKPLRPYKGATSMEDSDEKRFKGTQPPLPPHLPDSPVKPVIQLGNPYRFEIPAPATPPPRTPAPILTFPTTTTPTTKKIRGSVDESDEDKQSEESKEDDESKETSSEEKTNQNNKRRTTLSPVTKGASQENPNIFLHGQRVPLSSNFVPNAPSPLVAVSRPIFTPTKMYSSTIRPLPLPIRTRPHHNKNHEEKQNEDSNQTKEDSREETKSSKENESEENNSSEEKDKLPKPPLRKRKPEDDELESPAAQFPPLPPVVGDINAVGEILGRPEEDHKDEDEDVELYGVVDNIPAAPPLALQGFASSLEILVPTKPPPIRIVPLSNNPPPGSNNVGGQPGSPLGFGNSAATPSNGQGGPAGVRDPGDQQFQQFIRNPGSSSSNNRGPSGNRRPQQGQDQNQSKNQQGNKQNKENNKKEQQKENSSEEKNSSEENKNKSEDEESSEENTNPLANSGFPTNEFDEAILSLGFNDDDDGNGNQQADAPGKSPPAPPPVFVGGTAQKQQFQNKPFLPRPVPQKTSVFYSRPPGFRREPILKNQLPQPPQQQQFYQQPVPVFSLKPSAAAMLTPNRQPGNRPPITSSFSVSHLLRPLLPQPIQFHRKPLDPKIVQWIRETYGIPEVGDKTGNTLQDPNRSGLQSGVTSSTTPTSTSFSKKKTKTKVKVKTKAHKNKSTETIQYRSSEKLDDVSAEEDPPTTITTTESEELTTTEPPTTTTRRSTTTQKPTSTTTKKPTTTSRRPTTTTTQRLTTTSTSTRRPTTTTRRTTTKKSKPSPDYITEDDEAKMAQALFGSSEEEESQETQTRKSTVRTKVGSTKLTITVKSVKNRNNTASHERSAVSSENVSSLKSSTVQPSSSRKKKPSPEKRKQDTSSSEESEEEAEEEDEKSEEYKRKRKQTPKSSRSSTERRKVSSGEKSRTSQSTEKASKPAKSSSSERRPNKHQHHSSERKRSSFESTDSSKLFSRRKSGSDLDNPGESVELQTTPKPKPKPIKLPPIFGKHTRRKG